MGSSAGEVPRARREVSRAGTTSRAGPRHRCEVQRTGRIGTTNAASLTSHPHHRRHRSGTDTRRKSYSWRTHGGVNGSYLSRLGSFVRSRADIPDSFPRVALKAVPPLGLRGPSRPTLGRAARMRLRARLVSPVLSATKWLLRPEPLRSKLLP